MNDRHLESYCVSGSGQSKRGVTHPLLILERQSMEIRKIYAVNQGDTDRHSGTPKWFFDSKQVAVECSIGRGWYGGNAPIGEHSALVIDGKAYLLARAEPVALNVTPQDEQAKKNAARAKLTEEERKLLGIV